MKKIVVSETIAFWRDIYYEHAESVPQYSNGHQVWGPFTHFLLIFVLYVLLYVLLSLIKNLCVFILNKENIYKYSHEHIRQDDFNWNFKLLSWKLLKLSRIFNFKNR